MSLLLKIAARFHPREPRSAVNIDTSILTPDDRIIRVRIHNISRKGFMAESACRLKPDTWVGIDMPGYGIVPSCVRWSDGTAIGGQFRNPINMDRLRSAATDEVHGLFDSRILQPPL